MRTCAVRVREAAAYSKLIKGAIVNMSMLIGVSIISCDGLWIVGCDGMLIRCSRGAVDVESVQRDVNGMGRVRVHCGFGRTVE